MSQGRVTSSIGRLSPACEPTPASEFSGYGLKARSSTIPIAADCGSEGTGTPCSVISCEAKNLPQEEAEHNETDFLSNGPRNAVGLRSHRTVRSAGGRAGRGSHLQNQGGDVPWARRER